MQKIEFEPAVANASEPTYRESSKTSVWEDGFGCYSPKECDEAAGEWEDDEEEQTFDKIAVLNSRRIQRMGVNAQKTSAEDITVIVIPQSNQLRLSVLTSAKVPAD